MTTITGSSLTGSIVDYYERRLLSQPEFQNDLLKYGVKAQIPKGNSDIIHWTRVDRFGRAQTVTDGTDLSTERTPTISTVQGKLALFGDFVKITPYGDDIRIFSMIDKSYDEFILQASREANLQLQTTMIAGDSTTGNSFPAATELYCGGANTFTDLTTGGNFVLTVKDLERAIYRLRKRQAKGRVIVITNAWGIESLMLDDKFRTLIQNQGLDILMKGELAAWSGSKIGYNDDPFREDLGAEGGVKGTYSSTGKVFTTWVFGEEAFGTVQLMGRGGLRPRFKTQDISIIGNLVTIGYFLPFKGGVLNANWCIALRHVSESDSSIATFV
jgi:N4-gp56 family major capsid protein